MANLILVQFLILLPLTTWAAELNLIKPDLGEKKIDDYKERYFPDIKFDHYLGGVKTSDQIYWDSYTNQALFPEEKEFVNFLKSELNAGLRCPDHSLATNFEEIHYAYRLLALSYLIEGQWHMGMVSQSFGLNSCKFSLSDWIKTCKPRGKEMKNFLYQLVQFNPRYDEMLPDNYSREEWLKEFRSKKFRYYSHYRIAKECKDCSIDKLETTFNNSCISDQKLMTEICSERDEAYGLSDSRDAYFLLSSSNIINSFNQKGDAVACLRRFSEVMKHKEANYQVFKDLFNVMRTHLQNNYGERFSQGRVFFYGAGKEFETKGLKNIYVEPQKFVITELIKESDPEKVVINSAPQQNETKTPEIKSKSPVIDAPILSKPELPRRLKSAFLQAAETVKQSTLNKVEVDMLKLKYDHVFTLFMIHNLSTRLNTFMTRDALIEMVKFDKLGTKQSPVPLLFIKYMIDMEEHKGLWNLVGVLGDKFYVSNQIDESYDPVPELVQLTNNESSGNQWQIYILKNN